MKISFLSDAGSWKNPSIDRLVRELTAERHQAARFHDEQSVPAGDLLVILGFFKIVPAAVLRRNKTNIVIHESALPKGRGMSPVSWQVLEGAQEIPLTLFEAVEKVDAGHVYLRGLVRLSGDELLTEIREKVAKEMVQLCLQFVAGYPGLLKQGTAQTGESTYYRWRKPEDSRLDPTKSITEQFNQLRIVDNEAYPAFFTYRNCTYVLKIEKKKD